VKLEKEKTMKKQEWMARQGDLLIRKIEKLPDGKRKKRANGHILEGEVTGHVHRIAETQLDEAQVLDCGAGLFMTVTAEGGVSIVHEDHNPIVLPPGNYEVVRQREYTPSEIRNVQD
jgi:hypothetical protein